MAMGLKNLSILFCLQIIFWTNIGFVNGIVGGSDAENNQFKYQATLMIEGNLVCGGAIISDEHILTAAHCVLDKFNNFETSKIIVLVGATKSLKEDSLFYEVKTAYVHVGYRFNVELFKIIADIAVLKLKKSLKLNTQHRDLLLKLKIPVGNEISLFLGEEALIAGCGSFTVLKIRDATGQVVFQAGPRNNELKFVQSNVIDNFRCTLMYFNTIHESNLCSQTVQRNPAQAEGVCEGDSGGPLVINGDTVIGILANGPSSCNEQAKAAVYTRVTSFTQFVTDAVNGIETNEMRIHNYRR